MGHPSVWLEHLAQKAKGAGCLGRDGTGETPVLRLMGRMPKPLCTGETPVLRLMGRMPKLHLHGRDARATRDA